MLSAQEKRKLRAVAQTRKALFQIGKGNIKESTIKTISDSLTAHELVKISLLKTCSLTLREAALDLSSATHSQVVQQIGRTIVLYRRSKRNLMEL